MMPELLHRRLADSANMLVWMTDVDDVCIYLNQSTLVGAEQWAQINISAWAQFIHPDDRARFGTVTRQAKETRNEYQVEYRIIKSDGSIRWMKGSAAPRLSAHGEFIGYNGTVVDVSDCHEALDRQSKSEAGYRLLTEHNSDLISHYAADASFLYTSPSYVKVLGYGSSELLGTNVYDILHPDDIPTVRQEILQQENGGHDSVLMETRKRHKDGHYVWMGTKVRVLIDPITKEKTGTVATSRNITLERQAREELRKREERFRSLTNLSSDWYWETNEEDRFTFVSEGLERLFGFTPSQVIGKSRREIAADPNQPGLMEYFAKVARRESFKDIPYASHAPLSGAIRHALVSGEPVFEDGVFRGYRGVGRDITEELQITQKLAQLADANKALIENSLDIMVMLDHEGRYLQVNEAVNDILGYAPEELLGRHYTEFLVPEDHDISKSIEAGLRTGQKTIQDFENRWIRKDGEIVHLSSAIRWSDDKQVLYATARDVTDRHHVRTELQKSKDELVQVFESIGEGFYALDRNWRVTHVNQKTAKFIGIPEIDLLGKTVWEIVPDFQTSSIYPYFKKTMETGENTSFEEYFEPVDAWVEARIYPHADGLSVFFHDVTDRRKAQEAIRAGELRLRNIIGLTPAGYVLTDARGIIVDVNPAFCTISGYTKDELVGRDVMTLLPNCPLDGALSVTGGTTAVHGKEAIIKQNNGQLCYVLINVSIERDGEGNALSLTAFVTDITDRKQSEARLEQLATHDSLTGLPNRALINVQLQQMLTHVRQDETIAVMFIDLDRFKEVNDSLGHIPGDALLQDVANRLKKVMRPNDIVARLGGDEFIAVAYCSKGGESAAAIADKLLYVLAAPFDIQGQEVFVSASIGISMFPQDGTTNELLFQNADMAMYRAKAAGRNGYCFFEAEMSVEAKTRMAIEHALRRALERNEFELHYQPRIDLKTMEVTGMEALIRWNHPQLGRIPPLQFIPIAEERGFIEAIGWWVLEEACLQTRRLIDKFGRPLHVSVNLSARQLKCHDLLQQVGQALEKAQLSPHLLELELTESALIEDIVVSVKVLKSLRAMGVQLSVDDFGTGYSGLSYLRRFPLDILKLDRSFLNHESDGVSSFAFIKAFVDMSHALNLTVVAEGVEDMDACQLLRDAACDGAQGYLFSRPLALPEFESYLARLPRTEAKQTDL
jgi:diguanylate cyclase (GGDEF)-like protein/PAS domain S-box-containing protein